MSGGAAGRARTQRGAGCARHRAGCGLVLPAPGLGGARPGRAAVSGRRAAGSQGPVSCVRGAPLQPENGTELPLLKKVFCVATSCWHGNGRAVGAAEALTSRVLRHRLAA